MDLRHLEYIVALAEEKNVSRAADKLYITQPTLSQYLLKVEEDLGVPLFNRMKNSLTLTYAGEVYVNTAKEILYLKKNADNVIEDIMDLKKGRITLGITQERGFMILPAVFPQFQKKYPGIQIELVQNSGKNLETLALQGYVDISLLSLYQRETELDYEVLCKEEIILAIPKSHKLAHLATNSSSGERPIIDMSLLKDESFVLMKPGNKIRQISDRIFIDAGIAPKVILETDSIITALNLSANSGTLTLVPAHFPFHSQLCLETVNFSINPEKYSWDFIAAYRKGTYLSGATKDFISMIKSLLNTETSSR